jgi:hypothetical protein
MIPLLIASFVTAIALGALAWIALRLSSVFRPSAVDAEWWDHFQPEKYRPLSHLLDFREVRYLRSQPSCGFRLIWAFRAERARICLRFLREIKADFEQLQVVGQALVVAGRCSPEFHEELFRQRVRFTLAWWRVRAALPAWRLGWLEPDASPLLQALESSAAAVRVVFAPAP